MPSHLPNEKQVREFIADYMQRQYPEVIYRFDLAADQKLTVGQAVRNKKLQPLKGYPDMFIASTRGDYAGFYLELKRKESRVFLKDGSLSTSKHIQEQNEVLKRLRREGYRARFGVGIDHTVKLIDEYLQAK